MGSVVLGSIVLAAAASVDGSGAGAVAASRVSAPHPPDPSDQRPAAPPPAEAASHNVVARARMLECGHQWNNMKKAGAASGTWKDFSRGCLAQR